MTVRVLHLIPYMHPAAGGPPVVVDRWSVELQQTGISSQVLTTDAYSAGKHETQWIDAYREHYPITVAEGKGPLGFGYSSQLKNLFVERLADVDLVHVHNLWGYTNLLASKHCVAANVPFVVSTHGMLDPNSVGRKWLKKRVYGSLIEFPALRKASGMMFTHAEEERLARESCPGLPTGHIVSLGTEDPPAMSREQLSKRFRDRFPETQNRPLVVFLSRLHSKKGLDLLIPAMTTVIKEIPEAILALVGPGDDSYVDSLKGLVAKVGIQDNVMFTGALSGDDKWAALAAADIYTLPSYQENFAIAMVEALRIGTPVLCSRRVNLWKDLSDAKAASICELDAQDVAERIIDVLKNADNAKQMGQRGSQLAAEKFTWKNSARELAATYARILKAKSD